MDEEIFEDFMDYFGIPLFGFGNNWRSTPNFTYCAILHGYIILLCKKFRETAQLVSGYQVVPEASGQLRKRT